MNLIEPYETVVLEVTASILEAIRSVRGSHDVHDEKAGDGTLVISVMETDGVRTVYSVTNKNRNIVGTVGQGGA